MMKLMVKMWCVSAGMVPDAEKMLAGAGFGNFRRSNWPAAHDASVIVEVDDGQMDAAPMGGAHILGAVADAVMCVCDGVAERLSIQEAGPVLPWSR